MKAYIAGKITGDSTYREKFKRAGAMCRRSDYGKGD